MIKFSKEIMELAIRKIPNPDQIVILCSSGVDSIAASYYFWKTNHTYRCWNFFHFNHGQRHQNDLMQENFLNFVMDTKQYIKGIPLVNLKDYIKNNTEDSFRKARIDFIKNNFDKTIFITAHHLDDATESYMLNVLRGKEGFLPIPFITEVGTNLIVHPFLFTKKKDFIEYAEKNDLMKYVVEDETNKVTKGSRRNFIRNDIIPLLEREKIGLDTIVKKKMKERLMLELIKN
jgi:tRNA(Ile)-lysidine synthetase-like protein